ncbi:MAG TPA: pyridoxal-phosphate dependent enzyme, partial [Solirubrobacteraceae bacterium]|nr:pyridoxal-phosphate dependent enzyme [Solirubrobacteraceae bacterium]
MSAAEHLARRLAAGDARQARARIEATIRHTPVLSSRSLSERWGGEAVLKAENLQRTGSFKLRGALHRLEHVQGDAGVIAASAGNHGQAVAFAARSRGVPCEVLMPADAPVAKVAAVAAFGGTVTLTGESVDNCIVLARERAAQTGAVFVHPFDDPEVVLGQATLGVELLDDVPELACVVVPVGGGGLITGIAGAIRAERPVHVIGVLAPARPTIADGIAIKRPGALTAPLIERWVDELVTVEEDEVAEAMVWLMERAKLVVEGAGAVTVAALLAGRVDPPPAGRTAVVLSGGNVDSGLLSEIVRRHESTAGRRLRLFTRIPDRPGGLARLLEAVARAGGNVVQADHVRDAAALHVRETGIELALETRGSDHGEAI